ncbi:MAG: hypothetical protein EP329_22895 [Deltaproteobacteria bacterium]|nr:MAG: hypothetical protein EP329_22895 [Deltaproteobacteria bacterium]
MFVGAGLGCSHVHKKVEVIERTWTTTWSPTLLPWTGAAVGPVLSEVVVVPKAGEPAAFEDVRVMRSGGYIIVLAHDSMGEVARYPVAEVARVRTRETTRIDPRPASERTRLPPTRAAP